MRPLDIQGDESGVVAQMSAAFLMLVACELACMRALLFSCDLYKQHSSNVYQFTKINNAQLHSGISTFLAILNAHVVQL